MYHQFCEGSSEIEPYGSFEVFYMNEHEALDAMNEHGMAGWYWHACDPGYLPNGEPTGPFYTEEDAYKNAQRGA